MYRNSDNNILGFFLFLYILLLITMEQINSKVIYVSNILMILALVYYKIKHSQLLVKYNSIIVIYIIFLIYSILSLLWAVDISIGLLRSINLLFISINLIVILNILYKINTIAPILFAFIIFTIINFLLLNNLFGYQAGTWVGIRFVGTTGNANGLAITLFLSNFMSFYYLNQMRTQNKYFYIIYMNIFMSLFTIIATGSKKGLILSAVLLVSYIFSNLEFNKKIILKLIKNLLILATVTFILIQVVDFSAFTEQLDKLLFRLELAMDTFQSNKSGDKSTKDRLLLIQYGYEYFQNNPLLGMGNTSFTAIHGFYAHNNYIDILANLGLVGFIIYYSMHILLLLKIFELKEMKIKILFLFFVISILMMDFALVSYYSKVIILFLTVVYFLIEKQKILEK